MITTFGTYSGCAMMLSFTGSLNTSPKEPGATLDVLSVVSLRVAPAGEALGCDRATGSEPPEIAPDRDFTLLPGEITQLIG
jgi:hypothetical protein